MRPEFRQWQWGCRGMDKMGKVEARLVGGYVAW